MDAATFLNLLFGDAAGPDALIGIWTLPDKRTRWFLDCDKAGKYARFRGAEPEKNFYTPPDSCGPSEPSDVYFGCGLYRPGITTGRGKANDVVGLVGLWADVDYGGPPTKGTASPRTGGKNYPPTIEAATAIIDRIGVPPSIVVHSGHGLQPWWLFKEFLPVGVRIYGGPDRIVRAAQLSERWGATIQAAARTYGDFSVDSVHDHARVLRPPGTVNRKAEPVKVTAVVREPLPRYEPEYLESMCTTEAMYNRYTLPVAKITAQGTTEMQMGTSGILDLRPGRQLTVNVLQVERRTAIDKRFKATWEGNRRDLPDGSPSSYDMALAHCGVLFEWSDQQIADLIYLWRTIRGLNPQKACRHKQMTDTIHKARQAEQMNQVADEIVREVKAEETPKADDPTDPRRKPILERLEKLLRIPLARWVQYGAADADYTLLLKDGREIVIGPVEAVTNQTRFRNAVYQTVGILPTRKKSATWDGICRCLAIIRETVENPEEGREFEAIEWVTGYLKAGESRHIHTGDLDTAIENRAPFRRAGRLHVSLNALWEHLTARAGGKNLTKQMVRKGLRAAGFVSTPVTAKSKRIKSQRFWRDDKDHFAENVVQGKETQCSQKQA